jgi:hypothetical protein
VPKTLAAPPAGIRAAYRRMTAHDPGPFAVPTPPHHLEQTHHGTTDAALAAWYECRPGFRGKVAEVLGLPDYLVPDMDGHRTIRTPALVIVRQGGLRLHLTGCSWSYGGEGPHGTALILVDLGLFADVASAMPFVASRPEAWSVRVPPLA